MLCMLCSQSPCSVALSHILSRASMHGLCIFSSGAYRMWASLSSSLGLGLFNTWQACFPALYRHCLLDLPCYAWDTATVDDRRGCAGFAIADVNYGGSTGYGREYRNRLRRNWGIVDVADCSNAAKHLAKQGKADPKKLCIDGGSAGGYTTLACLAFR